MKKSLSAYYLVKPLIPPRVRLALRRFTVNRKRPRVAHRWPIDPDSANPPKGWKHWPDQKQFAFVLTHDVESQFGHERSIRLAKLEEKYGFRSSFNFVPERYRVSEKVRQELTHRGFEVGVHGLNHDGKLYKSKKIFLSRAQKINQYLEDWGAVGFRSPAMHKNLEWIHHLNITYDASTFDTDPFEPFPDGLGTIFPMWCPGPEGRPGYMELPYTLPQDSTVFSLMKEQDCSIWKNKLDWIAEHGGMVLLNVHPDYICFPGHARNINEFPLDLYQDFLKYISVTYKDAFWHALPREVAQHACTQLCLHPEVA